MTRVLLVDDEPGILRTLGITLRVHGYIVDVAADGTAALAAVSARVPDVVVLDLGLPDLSGVEVIRRLRQRSAVPILVLSGRSDSGDKVAALDAGADDYVTKPFGVDELLARLRAMLRRLSDVGPSENRADDCLVLGDVTVDLGSRRALRGGVDVRLTPTEWHLLEVFARKPGRLLSQQELLAEVWGPGYETAQGNLRLYVAQLRRKLELDPGRPRHILTEPGMGYRFVLAAAGE